MNIFLTDHAVVTDMNSMSPHSKHLTVILYKKRNLVELSMSEQTVQAETVSSGKIH